MNPIPTNYKVYSSDHMVEHEESCPHFFKKWSQDCNCDAWGRAGLKMLGELNRLSYENALKQCIIDSQANKIKAAFEALIGSKENGPNTKH